MRRFSARGGAVLRRGLALARAEFAVLLTLTVVAGGLWGFVKIAGEVLEGDTDEFDRAVILLLRNPADPSDPIGPVWFEEMMRDATALGSHFFVVLASLSVLFFLMMIRKWGAAVLVLAAVAGGTALSFGLKLAFERTRPDLVPHGAEVYTASFPSGHATLAAVTLLTLGALLTRLQVRRRVKAYFLAVSVLTTLIVGVSRIYLGVHWPTDVMAGWFLGSAWAMLVWLAALWLQRRGKVEPEGDG